jgi:hypothetical protein
MCKHFTVGYLALSLFLLGVNQSMADSNANTNPFGNGVYVVTDQAPDNMKTTPQQTGQLLHAVNGTPTPVRPFDQGVVRVSGKSDNNQDGSTTVTFVGRSPNWGCAYHVDGTWKGGGGGGAGGKPSGWYSDFNNDNPLRIVIEVNEDGAGDDVILVGGTGTLRVWVLGTTGDVSVNLSTNPTGIVSGLPGSDNVTAGESTPKSFALTGQSGGQTTITASKIVGGQTITDSRTVKVLAFRGKLIPADNLTGRSYQKLGVGETGTLGVDLAAGTTLDDLKPLTWAKTAGDTFGISNVNTNAGTASFTAGGVYEQVTLTLTDKNENTMTYNIAVVPPSGAQMENQYPGVKWHVQNTASVGFLGIAYLRPNDVSFAEVDVRESGGVLSGSGVLAPLTGQQHPTRSWSIVGSLSASQGKGCEVYDWVDQIYVTANVQQAGSYSWPANWEYKLNGNVHPFSASISQTANITAAGGATVSKAGHSESANWADQSSTPEGW